MWLLQGVGGCVVAMGGMHGCSQGVVCMVAPGGHVWLLLGACVVAPRGACMVALGGMHGCSWGGMCGCSWGPCVVASGGACMGYDKIWRYGQ